jgi:hypothetical protein
VDRRIFATPVGVSDPVGEFDIKDLENELHRCVVDLSQAYREAGRLVAEFPRDYRAHPAAARLERFQHDALRWIVFCRQLQRHPMLLRHASSVDSRGR